MSEAAAGTPHESDAATVLAAAETVLRQLETAPQDAPLRNRLLLQSSLLARLAADLLLEPGFPALPEGFERLLERDRARQADRQLARSRDGHIRSLSKKGGAKIHDRKPGHPAMEIDRRLAAETAATIRGLEATRLDLFAEYLHLQDDSGTPMDPEVEAASLALVDRYWRAQRRLLKIAVERPPQGSLKRSRKDSLAALHRPHWEHDITWDLWRSLDKRYLFWSDPAPPDPPVLSQEL